MNRAWVTAELFHKTVLSPSKRKRQERDSLSTPRRFASSDNTIHGNWQCLIPVLGKAISGTRKQYFTVDLS